MLCDLCDSHGPPPSSQILFGMVVSVYAGALLLKTQPFVNNNNNKIATLAQWVVFLELLAALLFRVQALLEASGGSVTVTGDSAFDADAMGVVVVVLVWGVPFVSAAVAIMESIAGEGQWGRLRELQEAAVPCEEEEVPVWKQPFVIVCGCCCRREHPRGHPNGAPPPSPRPRPSPGPGPARPGAPGPTQLPSQVPAGTGVAPSLSGAAVASGLGMHGSEPQEAPHRGLGLAGTVTQLDTPGFASVVLPLVAGAGVPAGPPQAWRQPEAFPVLAQANSEPVVNSHGLASQAGPSPGAVVGGSGTSATTTSTTSSCSTPPGPPLPRAVATTVTVATAPAVRSHGPQQVDGLRLGLSCGASRAGNGDVGTTGTDHDPLAGRVQAASSSTSKVAAGSGVGSVSAV